MILRRLKWAVVTALLVSVSFLNGCTVNQANDVQIYRHVLNAGKTKPAAPFHPGDPLSLGRALRLASEHNERLAIAGEDYLQALIDKDRAFAAFLPTINFAPTFMRQEKTNLAAGNPLIASFVPDKATDVPVQGNLDLNLFRDIPAFRAAKFSAQIKKFLLLDSQAIILLDVAKTYFQVMNSEKQVHVLTYSMKVREQRLEDIRVKYRVGVARPLDVSVVEAQMAKTHDALIQAKNDMRNGRAMLALLIGVSSVEGPLTGGLDVPPANWRSRPLLALAYKHRQDLAAARAQVRAAAASLESAWGEYFPAVSLNFTRYLSRESFPNDVDWTSLIQVNIPIFSAGLIHADVRTAYSRLRQARLAELNLHRQILKELRVAVEDLCDDIKQIEQIDIQIKAAQERVTQTKAEFNAGLGTNLELLTAQDEFFSAGLALATKHFDMDVDYLRLLRITGALDPDLSIRLVGTKPALLAEKVIK